MGTEPTFPMCVMEVKPIGVFHMADEKGPDKKLICVPTTDPIWNSYKDITDLNPHRKKEITHFFQVYKDLEKKKVDVGGWGNAKEAGEIYKKCVERYQNSEQKKMEISPYKISCKEYNGSPFILSMKGLFYSIRFYYFCQAIK